MIRDNDEEETMIDGEDNGEEMTTDGEDMDGEKSDVVTERLKREITDIAVVGVLLGQHWID